MSLNKVILIGYLGQDPETKSLPSGDEVTNASLATSEKWKDKSGQKQERTTWFRLAFFGKLAEIAGEYLRKGSQVYVEGQVSARPWTDKQGQPQASLEVRVRELKMLGGRPEQTESKQQALQPVPQPKVEDEFDDSIPF